MEGNARQQMNELTQTYATGDAGNHKDLYFGQGETE